MRRKIPSPLPSSSKLPLLISRNVSVSNVHMPSREAQKDVSLSRHERLENAFVSVLSLSSRIRVYHGHFPASLLRSRHPLRGLLDRFARRLSCHIFSPKSTFSPNLVAWRYIRHDPPVHAHSSRHRFRKCERHFLRSCFVYLANESLAQEQGRYEEAPNTISLFSPPRS